MRDALTRPQCTRWIDALRSGEYAQGYNKLEYDGTYCCLGVLNALEGQPTNPRNGYLDGEHLIPSHMTAMNDGGVTFLEIAGWIERELLPECDG